MLKRHLSSYLKGVTKLTDFFLSLAVFFLRTIFLIILKLFVTQQQIKLKKTHVAWSAKSQPLWSA